MLKPAAATKGSGSEASERGAVPNLVIAQRRRKSCSAPNLGRPSLSHQALPGPVVDSRMTGSFGAGTGVGEEADGVPFPGTLWMQKGPAGEGALQASQIMQAPVCDHGSGQGARLAMVAAEEDINEWLPAADLWGPSVYVLPAQHDPDPKSPITGAEVPVAAVQPRLQNGAFAQRSHGAIFSRDAAICARPVAESVEEGEDQVVGSQVAHATSASAEAHASMIDEHTAPSDKMEEEALTLDQQLHSGRPRTPPRPRTSSGLPRQVLQVLSNVICTSFCSSYSRCRQQGLLSLRFTSCSFSRYFCSSYMNW